MDLTSIIIIIAMVDRLLAYCVMTKPIFLPKLNQYKITIDSFVEIYFVKEDIYFKTPDWECLAGLLEPQPEHSDYVHCCFIGSNLDVEDEDEWVIDRIMNDPSL